MHSEEISKINILINDFRNILHGQTVQSEKGIRRKTQKGLFLICRLLWEGRVQQSAGNSLGTHVRLYITGVSCLIEKEIPIRSKVLSNIHISNLALLKLLHKRKLQLGIWITANSI